MFRLPTTCFAEEDGAVVSSSRVLQWHWKAADAPGEAKTDIAIMSGLAPAPEEVVREGRRQVPRPHRQPLLAVLHADHPTSEEIAKEYNGRALVDLYDLKDPTKLIRKAGEQLAGFGEMR